MTPWDNRLILSQYHSSVISIVFPLCRMFITDTETSRSAETFSSVPRLAARFYCYYDLFLNARTEFHLRVIQRQHLWELGMSYLRLL